jgi:hypothetical protein
VDVLTKLAKSLFPEIEKMKLEGIQANKNTEDNGKRGNFRRQNNGPQILQRYQRNKDDEKVQNPLQNNMVNDEEGEYEGTYQNIHCLGDTSTSPHFYQSTYEGTLMNSQLNEFNNREKKKERKKVQLEV